MQKGAKLQSRCATLKQGVTGVKNSSFNAKWPQLSKTVQNFKIGHTLASHVIQKRTLTI